MEPDFLNAVERAREGVDPQWDDQDVDQALRGVYRRRRRQQVTRVAGSALVVILIAVGFGRTLLSRPIEPTPVAQAPATVPSTSTASDPEQKLADAKSSVLRFADGSTAQTLNAKSEL